VGEGAAAVAVPQRPDALDIRPQLVVDLDVAPLVRLDAGCLEAEIVGVGPAPGGDEQMAARDLARRVRVAEGDGDAARLPGHADAFRPGMQRHALALKNVRDGGRDVLILARDDPWSHLDDGDAAAEAPVHLRELEADVAAADDDEMVWQLPELHHAAVGEVGRALEAGDRRRCGTSADVDEDAPGPQHRSAHRDAVRAGEARVPLDDGAAGQPANPAFDAGARLARYVILARFDARHVDGDLAADRHAEIGGAARHVRGVGACHQRLRRDAAGVDTGAAEELALDDGEPHACLRQPGGEGRAGLARANDDGVVVVHGGAPRSVRVGGVGAAMRPGTSAAPAGRSCQPLTRRRQAPPGAVSRAVCAA
jgi:hypothetical protein